MKKFIIPVLALAPALASAQNLNNIQTLVQAIGRLVSIALPIVAGLALLAFFWGLARFIFSAGDEGAKDEGRRIMIWGVVALFVMVAVWGLVRFIGNAIGVNPQTTPDAIPTVPGL